MVVPGAGTVQVRFGGQRPPREIVLTEKALHDRNPKTPQTPTPKP